MTDSTETDIAREIVTDWLGMFDPPPQIDFQQSEFLQQAIVFHLKKLRAANAALKQMVSDKDGLLTALRAESEAAARDMRERCAKEAETAGCGDPKCMGCYGNQIAATIRDLPLAVVATDRGGS